MIWPWTKCFCGHAIFWHSTIGPCLFRHPQGSACFKWIPQWDTDIDEAGWT